MGVIGKCLSVADPIQRQGFVACVCVCVSVCERERERERRW